MGNSELRWNVLLKNSVTFAPKMLIALYSIMFELDKNNLNITISYHLLQMLHQQVDWSETIISSTLHPYLL